MSHRKIENPEQFRKNIREKLIVFFKKEKDSIKIKIIAYYRINYIIIVIK